MTKLIQFSPRRNMQYLIFLLVYHYLRKIIQILLNRIIKFNDSLVFTLIMFTGEFLGALAVIIYQNLFFRNKSQKSSQTGIKLIHTKKKFENIPDKTFKIILLIFFIAFFDFTQFLIVCIIPEIAGLSPTSDQRLCNITTISSLLLCTYGLKLKIGKHHFFSLIGMGICSFIIFIFELIYKLPGNDFGNFVLAYLFVLFRLIYVSFSDVTERYIVEYNFFNQYKMLSLEGLFGIILCTIYSFIISKNPFNILGNSYIELDLGYKIMFMIFLLLYFILSSGINIYKIICNVVYTPMAKSLPAYFLNPILIIYYFIDEKDFTSNGNKNYFYLIINIIISVVIDFFACIYNEIFILYYFGLEHGTHQGISNRARINSILEIQMDDLDNQQISNNTDEEK